jgi:hypothetical protein
VLGAGQGLDAYLVNPAQFASVGDVTDAGGRRHELTRRRDGAPMPSFVVREGSSSGGPMS